MSETHYVSIKKNVYPDLQVVISHKKYNDELEYTLLSFVKSEGIIVEETCSEEGVPDRNSYKEPEYYACRLSDDIIEVCDKKMGWVPAIDELNKAWAEYLAEKAILEGK